MDKKICNTAMVMKWLNTYISAFERGEGVMIPDGIKGAIIAQLEAAIKKYGQAYNRTPQEIRRIIFTFLFNYDKGAEPTSSKELTPAEWFALSRWCRPAKVDGVWLSRVQFPREVEQVMASALMYYSFTKSKEEIGKPMTIGELINQLPLPEASMIDIGAELELIRISSSAEDEL